MVRVSRVRDGPDGGKPGEQGKRDMGARVQETLAAAGFEQEWHSRTQEWKAWPEGREAGYVAYYAVHVYSMKPRDYGQLTVAWFNLDCDITVRIIPGIICTTVVGHSLVIILRKLCGTWNTLLAGGTQTSQTTHAPCLF